MPDRLAVIADVHGNRGALEAVLEDIRERGLEYIVNLGDCLYGPLDPAGTADILIDLNIPTVSGNEDRIIVRPPDDSAGALSLAFTRACLTAAHLKWLASLPMTTVAYEDFFLCHGSPDRDDKYLLVDIGSTGSTLRPPEGLQLELSGLAQTVVLCGHDHTPRTLRLPDGKLIVNPGSVGLQAYVDDFPYPHAMQTGTPHARYAILGQADGVWRSEHVVVDYAWDEAAALAQRNGREDWVPWLKTGRVR